MHITDSGAIHGDLLQSEAKSTTPPSLESTSKPEDLASSPSSNVLKTPFLHPSPASRSPPTPVLTADQATKYASVLSAVEAWATTPPPSAPKSLVFPLKDDERMWLTRECLLRYLRATKWSVPDTITRLLATLAWRREYILDSHTAEYFSEENATGKQVLMGYDIANRPCLYLNPGQQNTPRSDKQIEHLVFSLERTIDLMQPGQEALSLLINFREAVKAPSGGQGRQVLRILQSHYPERLGKALLINGNPQQPLPLPAALPFHLTPALPQHDYFSFLSFLFYYLLKTHLNHHSTPPLTYPFFLLTTNPNIQSPGSSGPSSSSSAPSSTPSPAKKSPSTKTSACTCPPNNSSNPTAETSTSNTTMRSIGLRLMPSRRRGGRS